MSPSKSSYSFIRIRCSRGWNILLKANVIFVVSFFGLLLIVCALGQSKACPRTFSTFWLRWILSLIFSFQIVLWLVSMFSDVYVVVFFMIIYPVAHQSCANTLTNTWMIVCQIYMVLNSQQPQTFNQLQTFETYIKINKPTRTHTYIFHTHGWWTTKKQKKKNQK